MKARLTWQGETEFASQVGKHEFDIAGSPDQAPTPVQLMAVAVTGCMAIDLVHILEKGRHPVTSLEAEFTGERSPVEPKRFTKIHLHYTMTGAMLPEHVERAIQLSRDKYCSVWATFRQDIELTVDYTINPGT